MSAQEIKIVFAGPMGAGKTTAICSVSDVPPVSTEVANTDQEAFAKKHTTVALDFGHFAMPDGTVVRLYGTPGQQRFSFMWEIVARGALGIILLFDASQANVLEEMRNYLDVFRTIANSQPMVIGIGRLDVTQLDRMREFQVLLRDMNITAPLFSVDVRDRADTLLLIDALLAVLEARTLGVAESVE
jgi:signal recognition particle receptor subunit beta